MVASSRRIDKIIFISSDIKKELIENRFPIDKLIHISNGVEVDRFRPPEVHERYNLKNVCFVGRLEEQKGVEYLIKSMDIIRSKENDVKLFIVGDGQLRDNLKRLSEKLELDNHIEFVGSVNDVLPYYNNARIFVLPSISEGMPLSLLEAMSCKLPVVVTMVGGNTEIVNPRLGVGGTIVSDYHIGENGVLVKTKDVKGLAEAILRLLRDDDLSKQLGGKARKLVEENYSQEKIVNEYINLYCSLM